MTSARRVGLNENAETYGNGTRGFTALATWEAAKDNDLVAAEQSERLDCYADAVVDDRVILAGATTSADYFRRIRAAEGQKHDGTPGSGVRFSSTAAAQGFQCTEDYAQVQDLVVTLSVNSASTFYVIYLNGDQAASVGCIAVNGANSGAGLVWGFSTGGAPGITGPYLIDCVAINNDGGGFLLSDSNNTNPVVYNCVAIENGAAGFLRNGGAPILKNALGSGNPTADFSGTFDAASVTNASSDTSAPGSDERTEQTFTFVDADNDDYHLAAADAGAKGFGTDLSEDATFAFDDDIDGDLWGEAWSIGFDKPVAAGGLTPGHSYQYRQRAKYRVSYSA